MEERDVSKFFTTWDFPGKPFKFVKSILDNVHIEVRNSVLIIHEGKFSKNGPGIIKVLVRSRGSV
jgi:hypothetical protein